jgi:hypothetical protein
MLAKTSYHWFPGHWTWTGEQFEWKSGEWVYKVKDMILVPPRWDWDGKQWVFHDGGWAKSGTKKVVYRTTPAPGGPDVAANPEAPPAASTTSVEPQPATTTVYVWTGVYVAPLILFPIWHPHYHYHWYHRHAHYRRSPAYRHHRYHHAQTHRKAHYKHHNNAEQWAAAQSGWRLQAWHQAIAAEQQALDKTIATAEQQALDPARAAAEQQALTATEHQAVVAAFQSGRLEYRQHSGKQQQPKQHERSKRWWTSRRPWWTSLTERGYLSRRRTRTPT